MLKVSLKRYFITGLLVVVPVWGTVLVLKTLFVTLDDSGLIKRVDGYVDGAALAPLAAAFG